MASIEQYALCAGLRSPGNSGKVTSINPALIAELMELLEYAARTPSDANLSAAKGMPASATWKERTCGEYRGCLRSRSNERSDNPTRSIRTNSSRLDLMTSVS